MRLCAIQAQVFLLLLRIYKSTAKLSNIAKLVASVVVGFAVPADAHTLTVAEIFARPIISRAYEQQQWVLRTAEGTGLRETAETVGRALAGLRPTYVSGLIYLENGTAITDQMASDYEKIRALVLAQSPQARFDVEISLNPAPPAGKQPFGDASALVAMMASVDARLHPDGWWFDFYSDAEKVHPAWITAAVLYAHRHDQTVGGNVFGNVVPAGSDAAAFVDGPVSGSPFGFDFDRQEVAALQASSQATVIVGHLQSNAQNGSATESCTYIDHWEFLERAAYLLYWKSQQRVVGFRFMYPAFYPLCPGAYAFDPLRDHAVVGYSFYEFVRQLILWPDVWHAR